MIAFMLGFLIVLAFLAVTLGLVWLLRSPLLWIGTALLAASVLERAGIDPHALAGPVLVLLLGFGVAAVIAQSVRQQQRPTGPDPCPHFRKGLPCWMEFCPDCHPQGVGRR